MESNYINMKIKSRFYYDYVRFFVHICETESYININAHYTYYITLKQF